MWISPRLSCIATIFILLSTNAHATEHSDRVLEKKQSLFHKGLERRYVVRTPTKIVQLGDPLPLVLVLHGGGGNARHAEQVTGFSEKAEQEGFIVVYPEGTGRLQHRLLTWNAAHCCGRAMKNKVDDVGFINALIDKLQTDYPIDSRRIYITGMSNGGMMTHRLGIELSDRIAAIAPVVATLFGDEFSPAQPLAALMVNGMLDKSVPYQGGPPGGRFSGAWDGTPAQPAIVQGEFWAAASHCASQAVKQDRGSYILLSYDCPAGRAVMIYLLKQIGHAWPGGQRGSRLGDSPGTDLNATDLIWSFFEAHSK